MAQLTGKVLIQHKLKNMQRREHVQLEAQTFKRSHESIGQSSSKGFNWFQESTGTMKHWHWQWVCSFSHKDGMNKNDQKIMQTSSPCTSMLHYHLDVFFGGRG